MVLVRARTPPINPGIVPYTGATIEPTSEDMGSSDEGCKLSRWASTVSVCKVG